MMPTLDLYQELSQFVPEDVTDRLAVEFLLNKLTPFEQEILLLHKVEELTFSEIGQVLGKKYRAKEFTGSAIRYHYEKIKRRLLKHREAIGL
jgi:DNA-directed RNA polymerase specialized sigma24 family protein